MNPTRIAWIGLVAIALALRAAGATQAEAPQRAPVLGVAHEKLLLAPDEDGYVRLADVLRAFEAASGWTVAMDAETARLVDALRFYASGSIEAEPAEVARTVDALVAGMGFRWTVVRDAEPRVLGLHSMDTTARTMIRAEAPFVPIEELARYERFPGLILQTVLALPHTDVRTLSNSLRSMVVDPNLMQIIPVGNTDTLVLQGSGSALNDLVAMLRRVDETLAGSELAEPPAIALQPFAGNGSFTVAARDDAESNLLELARDYGRATDRVLVLQEETLRLLQADRAGLSRALTVSGSAFPTFVEQILAERGYLLFELSNGAPGLVTCMSRDAAARSTVRTNVRYADARAIATCAGRPATLFQTVVDLPHVDVRTLSNSMRSLIVDPMMLTIVPAGNSSSLVLQGSGAALADLVAMLRAVEAAAAARPPANEPPAEGEAGGGGK